MILTNCMMSLFIVYIVQMKELQKFYSDIPEMIDLVRKCLQVTNSVATMYPM